MARPSHELPYAPGTPQLGLLERMARQLDGGRGHLAEAVQAVKDHGAGALHFAAGCKKAEVCEYLVEDVGVNVDAIDQAGRTPLVCAITADKSGYVNIVRYLLDHGANPDNVDIIGFTPLHEAAKIELCPVIVLRDAEKVAVLQQAESHGSFCELPASCGNKILGCFLSPLKIAIESHSVKCVKLLVKAGADVKGIRNVTPLHAAARHDLTDALKCLLDAGADPNVQDEDLPLSKMSVAELKEEGDKALHKDDHDAALQFYNAAMMLDLENIDAVLIGNRGYCRLLLGRDGALNDAHMCRKMRPDCADSCWLEGYSYVQVKEYEKACDSFLDGLKLKPGLVGIEKALRQALRLLTESDAHKKNGSEGPAAEYRPVYLYH